MKKKRLIPILLLKNGWLVQSKKFNRYQNLGNPVQAVKRLSQWGSDEIIYLDITKYGDYDLKRNDQNYPNRKSFLEIVDDFAKVTFMPMTIGGKINNINDIDIRLKIGADKVSINTMALTNIDFIKKASKEFGSQCIVVSVDVKLDQFKKYKVFNSRESKITNIDAVGFCKTIEDKGAGEILLNSVDNDGQGNGYDITLLNCIVNHLSIPTIACGGVGDWGHFEEALVKTNVDGVAAANIFHYFDQSVYLAKKYLCDKNQNIRKPDILEIN